MKTARQAALENLTTRILELGGAGQRSLFLRSLAAELRSCYLAGLTRRDMWKELQNHGYIGGYTQFTRAFLTVVSPEHKPPRPLLALNSLLVQQPAERTVSSMSEAVPPFSTAPEDEVAAQQKRLTWARKRAEEMRAASDVPVKKKFEFNPEVR
jgi:hypothetical protein